MVILIVSFLSIISYVYAYEEYICRSFSFDIALSPLEDNGGEPLIMNVVLDLTISSTEVGEMYCKDSNMKNYFTNYEKCMDFMAASAIEAKLKCFYAFISSFEPALLEKMDNFYGSELLGTIIDLHYDKIIMEGGSSFYLNKLRTILKLFELPHVKTVCETGYNLGHSAALAFIANPNMTVISFDMATHLSTVHSVALLQEKFPGKLVVVLGDSQKSVPDYFSNNKDAVCDVVLVDGGHEGNIPISDLINFRKASKGTDGRIDVEKRLEDFRVKIEEAASEEQSSFTYVQEEVEEIRTIAVPDSFVRWDALGKLVVNEHDNETVEERKGQEGQEEHPTLVIMDDVHMPYVQHAWQQAYAGEEPFVASLLTVQDIYAPCPTMKSAGYENISTQRAAVHMVNAAVTDAHLTHEPNGCLETDTPLTFKSPHYNTYPDRAAEVFEAVKTSYAVGVFM